MQIFVFLFQKKMCQYHIPASGGLRLKVPIPNMKRAHHLSPGPGVISEFAYRGCLYLRNSDSAKGEGAEVPSSIIS